MMKDDSAKPRYHSPLRSRQKEQTRDLILDAVDAILRRAPLSEVTIAAVAREADVTERTIYRHFASREDLLEALWRRALHAVSGGQPQQVETLDQILDLTRAAYQSFDANEGIVRALIAAPEAVDASKQPEEARLAMLREACQGLLAGVPEDEVNAVVVATHVLSGASAWSHLRDYCGLDGAEGGQAAALAIELIVEGAKARAHAARGRLLQPKKTPDLRGWISHRLLDQ
ncbi:MAG TPA: TetR/AcrR family transcriptional regulator [Xanthobacteraceae bacterium]|nr:TetR/AcrR family transcriptional regulator [Xanthobacteraceae bacterium]